MTFEQAMVCTVAGVVLCGVGACVTEWIADGLIRREARRGK